MDVARRRVLFGIVAGLVIATLLLDALVFGAAWHALDPAAPQLYPIF